MLAGFITFSTRPASSLAVFSIRWLMSADIIVPSPPPQVRISIPSLACSSSTSIAMGEYYSGTFRRGFRRKKRAEALLERLPRNTPLPVRYKPEHPDTSTLLLSDLGLFLAGF